MLVRLQCNSCSARMRGNVPDGTPRVKCPKCMAWIDVPPPEPPAEEEVILGELVEDAPKPSPVSAKPPPLPPPLPVVELVADEPVKAPRGDWDLLRPRAFGLVPRAIMGGLVYDLCDADSDDVIGRATEEVSAGKTLVGFMFGRQIMGGSIAVTDDATGRGVLLIERTNYKHSLLGAKPCKVKLRNDRDDVLVRFEYGKPAFGGIALDFDADCTLRDDTGEPWAVAEGPKRRDVDYVIRDMDGKKLARVRGKGKIQGFGSASSSWTGRGGWLRIALSEGFDASPAEKMILLGTAIAIEFIVTTIGETKPGTLRLN